MKLTIKPKEFAAAVASAAVALPAKPAVPILGSILLEPGETTLTIAAYDYDQSAKVTVPCEVDTGQRVAVSGKLLVAISKVLPLRKDLELTVEGGHFVITAGATQFTLPMLDVDDYPALPEIGAEVGNISAALLIDAITKVAHASAKDEAEARTALGTIQLKSAESILTVTAASHQQLASIEVPWTAESNSEIDTLIPAPLLVNLVRSLDPSKNVSLCQNDGATVLSLAADNFAATASSVEMAFPDWRRLFPKQYTTVIVANTADVVESLRRAKAVTEKSPFVYLDFVDDAAELLVDETIKDEFEIELEGESLRFRVNVALLLDSIASLDRDRIVIGFANYRMAILHPVDDTVVTLEDSAPVDGYRVAVMGGSQS